MSQRLTTIDKMTDATEQQKLVEEILGLKHELNATILAHNYQRPEVQDIADFVGDSLELSRQATKVEVAVIVFCGVHFMAESAYILNPTRTVLLSEASAGCPMADMIDVDDLREWKARYPNAVVVCYVNSSAAVKAESDICCTSANGVKVVESLPDEEVLFVPDQHLGHYISTKTTKRMILYPGYCATHQRVTPEHVQAAKKAHPEAVVIVHPECRAEVIDLADATLSTSQMLRYVKESEAKEFLIGTEAGILHRLRIENPGKKFFVASNALLCPDMKRTTLKTIAETMRLRTNKIIVSEDIRVRAQWALDRMLEVT